MATKQELEEAILAEWSNRTRGLSELEAADLAATAILRILQTEPVPCEHHYPEPNGQGFNPDQCLNCQEWRQPNLFATDLPQPAEPSMNLLVGQFP